MNTPFDTVKPASSTNKPLWAAVIILGVAVLAMAATLFRIQTKPAETPFSVQTTPAVAPVVASSAPAPVLTPAPAAPATAVTPQKQAAAPVNHAHTAIKPVAQPNTTYKPVAAPSHESAAPVAQVAKPICVNCGTVESVTQIQRDGVGGGGGALAGGVLGAVVGNQIGGGQGKDLATILGAIGGGIAGNAVEKKMKKETVYQVHIRMEDGSSRTLEQATPASVGTKVIVDGNSLQPFSR